MRSLFPTNFLAQCLVILPAQLVEGSGTAWTRRTSICMQDLARIRCSECPPLLNPLPRRGEGAHLRRDQGTLPFLWVPASAGMTKSFCLIG